MADVVIAEFPGLMHGLAVFQLLAYGKVVAAMGADGHDVGGAIGKINPRLAIGDLHHLPGKIGWPLVIAVAAYLNWRAIRAMMK